MRRIALAALLLATPALTDPVLSIDVTAAEDETLTAAFAAARTFGATASSVSIAWDEIAPGPEGTPATWPALANMLFPWTGLDFTLTFSVIDTLEDRRPPDLRGLSWDEPAVIAAFAAHADDMLVRLKSLPKIGIAIGNEIDAHLPYDQTAPYLSFFIAARDHLRAAGLPVGVKLTFGGLRADPARWQPLLAASDVVMVTYYPLEPDFSIRPAATVAADMAQLAAIAGDKDIWLMEAGTPSAGCGGSEADQAAFAANLAQAAQDHPQIRLISWTFLTDLPPVELERLTGYYGIESDCFARYLGSLGLRRVDGSPKPAAAALSGAFR